MWWHFYLFSCIHSVWWGYSGPPMYSTYIYSTCFYSCKALWLPERVVVKVCVKKEHLHSIRRHNLKTTFRVWQVGQAAFTPFTGRSHNTSGLNWTDKTAPKTHDSEMVWRQINMQRGGLTFPFGYRWGGGGRGMGMVMAMAIQQRAPLIIHSVALETGEEVEKAVFSNDVLRVRLQY